MSKNTHKQNNSARGLSNRSNRSNKSHKGQANIPIITTVKRELKAYLARESPSAEKAQMLTLSIDEIQNIQNILEFLIKHA